MKVRLECLVSFLFRFTVKLTTYIYIDIVAHLFSERWLVRFQPKTQIPFGVASGRSSGVKIYDSQTCAVVAPHDMGAAESSSLQQRLLYRLN